MAKERILVRRGRKDQGWWMKRANGVAEFTGHLANVDEMEVSAAVRLANPDAEVMTFCGRCAGTGRFVTMVLNGKPTGLGGECFRCEGKGWQTEEDEKRNVAYDKYAAGVACRQMFAGR